MGGGRIKKILIIDNDYEIMTSLSDLLREAGYYTFGVSSGNAAIEKIVSENFDLAFIDVVMPRMNGIDTLTELRRLSPKTQVIMMTGFPLVDDALESIKKGACDYITKPLKLEELFSKIMRAIEKTIVEEHKTELDIDQILNCLVNPTRRSILKLIHTNVRVSLTEIAKGLEIDDHTKVFFHIKLLRNCRLIGQDKEKKYILLPTGEKVLDCLKIMENYLSK